MLTTVRKDLRFVSEAVWNRGWRTSTTLAPTSLREVATSVGRNKAILIFERDGYKCCNCHKSYPPAWEVKPDSNRNECLVVDHIVPGAGNDESNLQTLCWACNSSKGGRSQEVFAITEAIKLLGRPVAYYPSIARVVGIKESLFLCQLIYWTPRARNDRGKGWIYKSADEMQTETGLNYKEQCHARENLKIFGVLEEVYERTTHRMYFRINPQGINKVLASDKREDAHLTKGEVPYDVSAGATLQKGSSYKGTENTTENTNRDELAYLQNTPLYDEEGFRKQFS